MVSVELDGFVGAADDGLADGLPVFGGEQAIAYGDAMLVDQHVGMVFVHVFGGFDVWDKEVVDLLLCMGDERLNFQISRLAGDIVPFDGGGDGEIVARLEGDVFNDVASRALVGGRGIEFDHIFDRDGVEQIGVGGSEGEFRFGVKVGIIDHHANGLLVGGHAAWGAGEATTGSES